MRARNALVSSALLLVSAMSPAGAQSVVRMLGDDLKHAGSDVWAIWTSPFDASPRSWMLAGAVVGGAALISPFDDEVDRWTVRDSASALFDALKPFRKGGPLFQGNKLVPVAGAVLITGYVTKNQNLRDGAYGCAASWWSNNMLRHQVIYRFINRRRPDHHKDNELNTPPAQHGDQYDFELSTGDTSWGHNSFPGGHVANLAACASFLNHRFEMGYVEPVLYAIAAGVGVGRLADRAHWASDQALGAVFGFAIGREVALRQRKRVERRRQEAATGAVESQSSSGGFYLITDPVRGVGVAWQREF